MKTGSLGSFLPDALLNVSPEQAATQGTSAIETRATQLRPLGLRLAALRLGRGGGEGLGASADADGGRLGMFVNGIGNFGSKDSTDREIGFDFHSVGGTAGVDYRFTENLVGGVALSYLRTESGTFGLGTADSNSYGLSLYGTHYVGGFYVDALAGFTWHQYDTDRRLVYGPPGTELFVDRTARGDTDARQYTINAGAGYDFRRGPVTLTPYGRVEFLHVDVDGYTEHGASGLDLAIDRQAVESLVTILGARLAYAISTPVGVFVPALRGDWRHEVLNDTRSIRARFANDPFRTVFSIPTDDPDRDYFALAAGVSTVFARGVAGFVDFETLLGLRGVTNHNFTAGVRLQF